MSNDAQQSLIIANTALRRARPTLDRTKIAALFGFLNIDKPSGITSRAVVNRVQRLVRPSKVGHAGTLDPLASGVLVVAIGPATRLIEYAQRGPKRYVGTFLLGRCSETEDIDGDVRQLADVPQPTTTQVREVLSQFIGDIQQRPPAYSALKVEGRRAYELARKGEKIKLQPRTVSVFRLELLEYHYPQLKLEIACGGGTYVRSLGRDIAEALGTSAVMSDLVRTQVGNFALGDACQPDELKDAASVRERLLRPQTAVLDLPELILSPAEARRIASGLPIECELPATDEFVATDGLGRLLAILTRCGPSQARALKNFPQQAEHA